jgi:cobalt/nickel transport system permease protein
MNKLTVTVIIVLVAAVLLGVLMMVPHEWSGVDETVVGHYAEEAGFPARDPYINTDQGDMLLFVFLMGGVIGGFIGGYYFHELFAPENT